MKLAGQPGPLKRTGRRSSRIFLAFLGGGVVKYRHRPDQVAAAEQATRKTAAEVKALEDELKKVSAEAQAAPPPQKEQMAKALAAMTAKMKAATDVLTATKQQMEKAKASAQPKDIADIVVCEPVTIRVLPGETK